MTYYIYKALKDGRRFKNWEFHSKYEDLGDAEEAARGLCPKGEEIETEPNGRFFGSKSSDCWSAMISLVEERV